MSVKITSNMMYIKDPISGQLVPFSMITSGANETIAEANEVIQRLSEASRQAGETVTAVYG